MVFRAVVAWLLLTACVLVHAGGVAAAMRHVHRHLPTDERFWPWTWLFVRLAGWMVTLHLIEIAVWAIVYVWQGALADLQSALYFSAVTYTTTGYGDVLLPAQWQLVAGVEALTGILMCGWSTGFFFAIVSRMFEAKPA